MSSQPTSTLGFGLILILGAIAALTPLAIDMYLPAMPTIASDLGVTSGAVQSTLASYTAGFAIGQLLHGPLSDSYGRRPVLLVGVAFFAMAAVVSALADDIHMLTWVRAAQGFAGAAAAVIIQALVRDMFEREEFARTMSFVTLVMTVAPLAAPMIGGYLSVWFGWRSVFWLLAGFAVLVLVLVTFKIPETLTSENRQPLRFMSVMRNYFRILRTPQAMGLIMSGAFSFAGMFSFLTAGSFVYIDYYGVSTQNFGYLFGLNVVCLIVMTSMNGRMVRRKGSHWMLRFGLTVQLVAGILMVIGQLAGFGLVGTVIPVMLFVGAISVVGSNGMACLLSGYPQLAGTASALSGTMRFGVGAVIGAVLAAVPGIDPWPMVISMGGCAVLSSVLYWGLSRNA
ncbi:Bcr/CflA family multidrug efflux MFS transporter [Parasalinivibrio latis]|uniref:Bcr/CflA family multidrug efflux MFS transporter n=1 Tax=Parasalinivibrio latis TaxID=2952610 RepID=UPI0030DF30CF